MFHQIQILKQDQLVIVEGCHALHEIVPMCRRYPSILCVVRISCILTLTLRSLIVIILRADVSFVILDRMCRPRRLHLCFLSLHASWWSHASLDLLYVITLDVSYLKLFDSSSLSSIVPTTRYRFNILKQ